MNISSISSTYSALGTSAVSAPQVSGDMPPPPDDDSGQVHRRHGGHGHGQGGSQMMQAVAQALQSLGLSLPDKTEATDGATAVSATDAASSATSATTSSATASTASSATGDIRKDMHDFMHALFEAVKADSSADNGSSSGSSGDSGQGNGDPRANFASGLAALVTQAANGNAPSELQSAFAKLQADLTGSSGTDTGSSDSTATASTTSGSGSAAQATLQALLTQLQQNLGYGSSASLAATGNVISTQV